MKKMYDDFFDRLAEHESSFLTRKNPNDAYKAVNQLKYLGKYQLGELALDDTGYYKSRDGSYGKNDWKEKAWTGKDNIKNKEDFLNNPEVQESAVREYCKRNWKVIRYHGLDRFVGKTINGVTVTESGMLAAAHLKGIGVKGSKINDNQGLRNFLESDGKIDPTDGNGTPVSRYLEEMGGYKTPFKAKARFFPIPQFKPDFGSLSREEIRKELDRESRALEKEMTGLNLSDLRVSVDTTVRPPFDESSPLLHNPHFQQMSASSQEISRRIVRELQSSGGDINNPQAMQECVERAMAEQTYTREEMQGFINDVAKLQRSIGTGQYTTLEGQKPQQDISQPIRRYEGSGLEL